MIKKVLTHFKINLKNFFFTFFFQPDTKKIKKSCERYQNLTDKEINKKREYGHERCNKLSEEEKLQ